MTAIRTGLLTDLGEELLRSRTTLGTRDSALDSKVKEVLEDMAGQILKERGEQDNPEEIGIVLEAIDRFTKTSVNTVFEKKHNKKLTRGKKRINENTDLFAPLPAQRMLRKSVINESEWRDKYNEVQITTGNLDYLGEAEVPAVLRKRVNARRTVVQNVIKGFLPGLNS